MNKEVEYLKEHLYEIYKYKKSMQGLTYDMNIELLLRTCKALDYQDKEIEKLKKCYCNRTDCSGRIKDSKNYDSLQQRIDKAIKKINELMHFPSGCGATTLDEVWGEILLSILEGEDNE